MRKYHYLMILVLMMTDTVYATGPSYIESEIRPVSINDNGEILCRTRFTKNETGAHRAMKVTYGYCILSTDTIIQFNTQEIEPDGFPDLETFSKDIEYWDSIFNSCFDKDHQSSIGYDIKSRYNFDLCNTDSYRVDKIQLLTEFKKTKNTDLDSVAQKALNGAKSEYHYNTGKIHILYDFGKIVILRNIDNEYEENKIGADFDYFNPWTNDEGEIVNIGFEISKITGVLFIE